MIQTDEEILKCHEHFLSPSKKSIHPENPLILMDITYAKYPYFCCSAHEEEFFFDFQSEEETMVLNDDFGGVLFLHSDGNSEIAEMCHRDEIGIQCSQGPPVSLKKLSSWNVCCKDGKIIIPRPNWKTLHEPLIILPRPILEIDEDDGSFQCKICFKIFLTGQALGGHTSRKHPK